ncbi:MAG TPA: ABC transporter ATP-binding protein [Acidimicrobiales bacterium]|nr:ABC transporter ATP-binding protein [Acidimicrobiales bacterium]
MADELETDFDIDALPAAVQPPGAVLSVRNLRVDFKTDDGIVKAVDDVSYDVFENEVLGIVGESGSGKTVSSLAILGLLPKTAEVSGQVIFRGRDLVGLNERALRTVRGNKISMVFQDALAALNPVFTVGHQIAEAIDVHRDLSRKELAAEVQDLLGIVGISNPKARADQYPHEYSGGMRQRAMIAMALANRPDVLIADEPTTALDVTIQAQVLEVFERVQAQTNSAILLITHDLGVVAGMADRVMVMYAGRQSEIGTVDEIFYEPRHPYTLSLLASLPRLDRGDRRDRLYRIKGQPPSLIRVPPGCPFNPRCPMAQTPDPCATEVPPLYSVSGGTEHRSACHFREQLAGVTVEQLRARVRA